MKTNDSNLAIQTDLGAKILEFDFPSFHIGMAEYPDGPTGVTVIISPLVSLRPWISGWGDRIRRRLRICACHFSGRRFPFRIGSGQWSRCRTFGQGGYKANWGAIPLVSGGIVYDFRGRQNSIYPDRNLGRAAIQSARPGLFALGSRGAGMSVAVGKGFSSLQAERAGQGAAFLDVGGVKFFACVVLNAMGAVYDRRGQVVRGNLNPETGKRVSVWEELDRMAYLNPGTGTQAGNTTLTVLVTNQLVQGHELTQLGPPGAQFHGPGHSAVSYEHRR